MNTNRKTVYFLSSLVLFAVLAVLAVACGSPLQELPEATASPVAPFVETPTQLTSAPPGVLSISLGQPFELPYGQTALLADRDLEITFTAVNDSRCPKDVVCVWAGEARVQLRFAAGDLAPETLEVVLPGAEITAYGPYQIELQNLQPVPLSAQDTPFDEYVATLVVTE